MHGQGGWARVVFVVYGFPMLVPPFLECLTSQASIRVGFVVVCCHCSFVDNIFNQTPATILFILFSRLFDRYGFQLGSISYREPSKTVYALLLALSLLPFGPGLMFFIRPVYVEDKNGLHFIPKYFFGRDIPQRVKSRQFKS